MRKCFLEGWHVVGCSLLSGLDVQRWVLRACMGVRGPDPNHASVLMRTLPRTGFSGPVSPTVVPYSPSLTYAWRPRAR